MELREKENDLIQRVHDSLLRSGLSLALAESCTGGLLSHWITSNSGSSSYYLGGIVTYSNQAKKSFLGVPQDVLERDGAVSRRCAECMAKGALERFGADLALSVTGIAGPTGGTAQKPTGLVYIGMAWKTPAGVESDVLEQRFSGDRRRVQAASARAALDLLEKHLLARKQG